MLITFSHFLDSELLNTKMKEVRSLTYNVKKINLLLSRLVSVGLKQLKWLALQEELPSLLLKEFMIRSSMKIFIEGI